MDPEKIKINHARELMDHIILENAKRDQRQKDQEARMDSYRKFFQSEKAQRDAQTAANQLKRR